MAEAKKEAKTKKEAPKRAKQAKEAELIAEVVPAEAKLEPKISVVKTDKPSDAPLAKAGKRSSKALKETEEKQAKQERKKVAAEPQAKAKPKQNPPRTRLERAGKKYREVAKSVDNSKTYELKDALELAGKTSPTKFDATVELHVNLNVDPKQADQNVRGTVDLPEGSGKTLRVAAFVEGDDIKKATAAGADIAGSDDLLAKLDKGEIDFDLLITSSQLMPQLGKYAKILGPKGLMPNPKSGTITGDIAAGVKAAKAGKVEYRVDQAGIIHLGIGKVSFGTERLEKNAKAVVASIKAAKPASVKSAYIKSAYLSTTMGPSIRLSL